jgi:hypothetical protein
MRWISCGYHIELDMYSCNVSLLTSDVKMSSLPCGNPLSLPNSWGIYIVDVIRWQVLFPRHDDHTTGNRSSSCLCPISSCGSTSIVVRLVCQFLIHHSFCISTESASVDSSISRRVLTVLFIFQAFQLTIKVDNGDHLERNLAPVGGYLS